jgi:hypothetical protein
MFRSSVSEAHAIRCRTLFGIPSGPGALSFLVNRIAWVTSVTVSSLGISTSCRYWNPTRLSRSAFTGGRKCIFFSITALLLKLCALTAPYISVRMITCVAFPSALFFTYLVTRQILSCVLSASCILLRKYFVFTLLMVLPLRFFMSRYSLHVSSDYARVNLLRNIRVSRTDRWHSGIHQGFACILRRAHSVKRSITL